jgi:AraC-like DNA-binding protein
MTEDLSKMTPWEPRRGQGEERHLRWRFTHVVESCGIRALGCGWWYRPASTKEINSPWLMDAFGLIQAGQAGAVFENDVCPRKTLSVGSCAILFPGVRHRYGSLADWAWEERMLLFDGSLVRDLAQRGVLDPHRPVVTPSNALSVQRCFEHSWQAASLGQEFAICPLIFEVLHQVTQAQRQQNQAGEVDANLLAVVARIRSEPQRAWDGKELAQTLDMTYSGFRQAFARIVGMPPHRFVLHERIQMACRLLGEREAIGEIAREVGIPDPARFARHFKSQIGYSPRDFRAMHARMH